MQAQPNVRIKKVFEIEAAPEIMARIERFMALLHWNSRHGHSGVFGMPLDGDGAAKVTVNPAPAHRHEVDLCASIGYDVEVAYTGCFGGLKTRPSESDFLVRPAAALYKNGEFVRALPTKLGD